MSQGDFAPIAFIAALRGVERMGALQWFPGPRSWRLPYYYSSVLAPIVSSSPLNIVIVSHHLHRQLTSPQKIPGPGSEPLLARLGVLPEFCTIHQTVDRRNLGRDRRGGGGWTRAKQGESFHAFSSDFSAGRCMISTVIINRIRR